jgi:hypothetical protein
LDHQVVASISAFLASRGGDDDPKPLIANSDIAFSGYYYYGSGFLFDDSNEDASSVLQMSQLIERDPRNKQLIHPIVGAHDLLDSPVLGATRYVIDFGNKTLEDARDWPDLLDILERKAMPARQNCNRERLRTQWWQFGEIRPGLRRSSTGLRRLLMIPLPASHLVLGFVPAEFYIASPNVAITLDKSGAFALLQSRVHELWARFFGSSMKDDLRYTPSDCFETFPFSDGWEEHSGLECAGTVYHEFRDALMGKTLEGLTQTYNRFHNPEEQDPDIVKLRDLHAGMDRAVLGTYGWHDIATNCDFVLDFDIDEDEWGDKRKPWRYRWPDEIRDEVLARLLELNRQRALEEGQEVGDEASTAHDDTKLQKPSSGKRSAKNVKQGFTSGLFAMDQEEV